MGIPSFLVAGKLREDWIHVVLDIGPDLSPLSPACAPCMSVSIRRWEKADQEGRRSPLSLGTPCRSEETPQSLFSSLCGCDSYVYFGCFWSNFGCCGKEGRSF